MIKIGIKLTTQLIFQIILSQLVYSQWVQQTVPVNKSITGIKFVDTLRGWACTDYGTQQDTGYILHTSNGGINWIIQVRAASTTFAVINVLDSSTGFAAGYDFGIGLGKIFKTTNGGLNWSFINMVPNMFIQDMQFLNRDSAWECGLGPGPDVRTTTDGGVTWQYRQNGITSSNTRRLFFLNYSTGFCGAQQSLFKTTNAGIIWTQAGNSFTAQVGSIFFYGFNNGWVGLQNDQMVHTTNGGINWSYQILPTLCCGTTTDLFFADSLKGWGGNRGFKLIRTTDGGNNWGYQIDSGTSYRLSFVDSSMGWSGSDLGIYHTTNGGGQIIYSGIVNVNHQVPKTFYLYQNFPNPFNSETTIKFDVKKKSFVKIIIYDVLGREVKTLVSENLNAGSYQYNWAAGDIPSGVYFYRLVTESFSETKKMTLIK